MSTLQLDNSNVGKVLGKQVDYPDQYNPSILVREPRSTNRQYLNLNDNNLPFCGYDVWNAYEVSCLTEKGLPVTAIAKIVYPCDNKYIVESKSLKLYLNSFNMSRHGLDRYTCLNIIEDKIATDLSELLETDVKVRLFNTWDINTVGEQRYFSNYEILELEDDGQWKYDNYNETPNLLIPPFRSEYLVEQKLRSSLMRSRCRVTSQPDFGDVFVYIKGNYPVKKEHLLKYIVSFRNECHFHEECTEAIYRRLWDTYKPAKLMVSCLYTRRGGIDINALRASSIDLIPFEIFDVDELFVKSSRQ